MSTPLTLPQIQFREWLCNLQFGKYSNGCIAIQLTDTEDGEPIATATVNMVHEQLHPDEVFIKNWSENEGILLELMCAGIVSAPIEEVQVGYSYAYKCKLLIPISNGK